MATKRRRKKGAGLESRIVPVDQANPHVKILVYGRNKKGKTRFCGSAPNVLVVDVNERGTLSIRGSGAKVFPMRTWGDIDEVYWYLKRGDHDYETVAIDTLTALNALCLSHVLKEGHDRDSTKDPKMPRRQDYGKVAEMMKFEILRFRNLPMHVIFTAQERTVGDPEEGEDVVACPDLPAGSRGTAMGSVSIVGRVYRKRVKRRNKKTRRVVSKWQTMLWVGDHEDFEAGDRTNSLGKVVTNPTMPKVIEAATNQEE